MRLCCSTICGRHSALEAFLGSEQRSSRSLFVMCSDGGLWRRHHWCQQPDAHRLWSSWPAVQARQFLPFRYPLVGTWPPCMRMLQQLVRRHLCPPEGVAMRACKCASLPLCAQGCRHACMPRHTPQAVREQRLSPGCLSSRSAQPPRQHRDHLAAVCPGLWRRHRRQLWPRGPSRQGRPRLHAPRRRQVCTAFASHSMTACPQE